MKFRPRAQLRLPLADLNYDIQKVVIRFVDSLSVGIKVVSWAGRDFFVELGALALPALPVA